MLITGVDSSSNQEKPISVTDSGEILVKINSSAATSDEGAGATTTATTRIVTATDSPDVVAIGSIGDKLMPTSGTYTYSQMGTATTALIKSGLSNLFYFIANNLVGSTRYLLLFDSVAALVSGTSSPDYIYTLPSNGLIAIGQDVFGGGGKAFSNGIVYGISTTPRIYTAATATDCTLEIRYQ